MTIGQCRRLGHQCSCMLSTRRKSKNVSVCDTCEMTSKLLYDASSLRPWPRDWFAQLSGCAIDVRSVRDCVFSANLHLQVFWRRGFKPWRNVRMRFRFRAWALPFLALRCVENNGADAISVCSLETWIRLGPPGPRFHPGCASFKQHVLEINNCLLLCQPSEF